MDDSVLDKKISETLAGRAERLRQEPWSEQSRKARVHQRIEEETRMKHWNWKRIAVAAAAICVLGSMTAMALGRATISATYSSSAGDVKSYAEAEKMQKKYDPRVKTLEKFSNGYRFAVGTPKTMQEQDDKGNVLSENKAVSFTYTKNGMSDILFNGSVSSMRDSGQPDETATGEDGTVYQYQYMMNKFVPVDYQATEEEKAQIESGRLNIGYGSEEIEEMSSKSVTWKQDGISYILFSFENTMSGQEMIAMAKEIAMN